MQEFHEVLKFIDSQIGGAQWFVFFLLGTGLFFTIYLKFPQVRFFRHAFDVVKGKFDKKDDVGDTTHFQSLATALSGTVGTGNIAGVALAIHLGGPAALFWMLVTAFFGMTTKFVEVTLSHKYRETASDGTMAGGPMYYMKNKLNMKWLAVVFAIATVFSSFGTGCLPQINSISDSIFTTFGIEHIITGAVLAVLLASVIIGGIKRIAKVTSRLVPAMAVFYFIGALAVIVFNYGQIIPSIISVFTNVFTGTAATGGFVGAGFIYAFNRGVNRGLFSNEAGQGSAPIAHAAAKTNEPVSEGMVALLEPFIDTIIICSLTGLVLLTSGVWHQKIDNKFQVTDIEVFDKRLEKDSDESKQALFDHLNDKKSLPLFEGNLEIVHGEIQNPVSILHARSLAENVQVFKGDNKYSGNIQVVDGTPQIEQVSTPEDEIAFRGESLIHSASLTTIAFTRSFLGTIGSYIVSIGLLLFAFSTAISWSYYGDRAMTFMFGIKSVIYYRIFYVIGFFFASFVDTTIVWTFSGITIALMTVPNLFGIIMLRKDMKSTLRTYLSHFPQVFPDNKLPDEV
jgi:alanine or glycine:cation symporter, AGCS family